MSRGAQRDVKSMLSLESSYRIHTHAICYASANAVHISLQHRSTLQGPWLCTFAPKEDIVGDEPLSVSWLRSHT